MVSQCPRKSARVYETKSVCKKFNEYIKDERQGNKGYLSLAKKVKCSRQKEYLRKMAADERKHRRWLKVMNSKSCPSRRR